MTHHHYFLLSVSTVSKVIRETCFVCVVGGIALHCDAWPHRKYVGRGGSWFFFFWRRHNFLIVLEPLMAYGSHGNARIFWESAFGCRLHQGHLRIPTRRPLPETTEPSQPLVIVADEAFGLAENLMWLYSGNRVSENQKYFNYRLSHARRVVECAFDVCTAKWRVLLNSM